MDRPAAHRSGGHQCGFLGNAVGGLSLVHRRHRRGGDAGAVGAGTLLANVGGTLRLTPGNVGVIQGAVVLGLAPAHVPAAQAVAAGLALQAVQVLPVLAVGIALLGRHGVREVFCRRATETV